MIASDQSQTVSPCLDELSTEAFLRVVGQRVRQQRALKAMSRKRLAEVSGVSERYLAQLESGQGNMSIALLRKVTAAIGMSLGALMAEEVTESVANSTRSDQEAHQNGAAVNGSTRVNGAGQPTGPLGARVEDPALAAAASSQSELVAEA